MEEDIITDLTVLQENLNKMIIGIEQRDSALKQFQAFQIKLFTINSLPEMIDSVLAQAKLFFELNIVSLMLLNEEGKITSHLNETGYNYQQNQSLQLLNNQSFLSDELTQAIFIGQYEEKHSVFFSELPQLPSDVIIIPLTRHGEYLGSLNLASDTIASLPPKIKLGFSSQIGFSISVCLENYLNFTIAQQAYRNEALANANNRRFLEQRLVEELAKAQRVTLSLTCLVLDVDFPVMKNHQQTSQLETQVLKTIAETVKRQLRVDDVFSYYESRKFAAFLTNVPETILITLIKRLKMAITEQVIQFEKKIIPLSISLGYANYQFEKNGAETKTHQQIAVELISSADANLYDSKHNPPSQPKKITAA